MNWRAAPKSFVADLPVATVTIFYPLALLDRSPPQPAGCRLRLLTVLIPQDRLTGQFYSPSTALRQDAEPASPPLIVARGRKIMPQKQIDDAPLFKDYRAHSPLTLPRHRLYTCACLLVLTESAAPAGPVAEWPCRGLQILVRRFDSGPGLQRPSNPSSNQSWCHQSPRPKRPVVDPMLRSFLAFKEKAPRP